MFQINKIGIGNFRVFKEMTTFDLSDITLLTGPNSSGKSSLTKALLLLQDNAEKNELQELDFSSELHSLGSFDYVLNKSVPGDEMLFIFRFAQNFLFANNLLWLIVPSMSIRLRYAKHSESGKLQSLIFTNIDSSSKTEKIILMIQPYSVTSKTTDMGMTINLDFLINKFKAEVLRLRNEPLKDVKIGPDDIGNSEAFTFSMQKPMANNSTIPSEYLEMAESSVLDIAKIVGLLKMYPSKKIHSFLKYLEDYVIEQYSSDYYSKEEWDEEDPYSSTDAIINAYGKYESVSYIGIFERHFAINRTTYKLVKEIDFKKSIVDWSKTNLNKNEIVNKKNDFKLYEDLIARIGDFPLRDITSRQFTKFLEYVEKEFRNLLSEFNNSLNFSFLESVRSNTQRLYTNQSQGTHFNELLLSLSRAELESEKIGFINKWLKKFKIGDELKIERISGVATKVMIQKKGECIELADLGYGVSQLLPILIKIVLDFNFLYKGKDGFRRFKTQNYPIMIIEEPETNLHPKFQSQLADLLVDAINTFGVRFLIETHSEYLIRKMQFLVASKSVRAEQISLYYFQDPDEIPKGEKQVKKIELLEDGSLSSDFGTGFFDEALNWKFELLKLKNKN